MIRFRIAAAVVAAMALLAGRPAGAVPLVNGNTVTVGSVTFEVEDCNPTACAGDVIIADGLGVKIENGSGGALLSASPGSDADLGFSLAVTTTGPLITGASLGVSGSAGPDDLGLVGGGETVLDASSNQLGVMSASLLPGDQDQNVSFAGQPSLTLAKDLAVIGSAAIDPQTLILTWVTQDLTLAGTPVPEPASGALIIVGLTGMVAALRRRRAA